MDHTTSQTRDVPASVRAVVSRHTIQIVLLPGVGMADGGIPVDLPIEMVPVRVRLPNSLLTVTMDGADVVAVRARENDK